MREQYCPWTATCALSCDAACVVAVPEARAMSGVKLTMKNGMINHRIPKGPRKLLQNCAQEGRAYQHRMPQSSQKRSDVNVARENRRGTRRTATTNRRRQTVHAQLVGFSCFSFLRFSMHNDWAAVRAKATPRVSVLHIGSCLLVKWLGERSVLWPRGRPEAASNQSTHRIQTQCTGSTRR